MMVQRICVIFASTLVAAVLVGCQVTLNGATLKDDVLKRTRRIAVVAMAADRISFYQQRPLNSVFRTIDTESWGLDNFYAQRFAYELSHVLEVPSVVYQGPKRDTLKGVYAPNAILVANRFDWKAVEETVRSIGTETQSDLVAVLLREEYQDPLARFKFLVSGFGFSEGDGKCAAFANLTLTIVDPRTGAPVAGANVYSTDAQGRAEFRGTLIPYTFCWQALENTTEVQAEKLQKVFENMITEKAVEQTIRRLLQFK